jgi:quercetin dioxygenase-like cupin family protein
MKIQLRRASLASQSEFLLGISKTRAPFLTTMEAGARIPAHRHSLADEFVYVVAGDFIEDGKTYGAGTAFWCKAGSIHGPHESTAGCKLITYFSAPLDFDVAG